MQVLALIVLIAAASWLAAIGVLMAARPERALRILSLTGSTQRINLTELGLRMAAGIALIVRSDVSRYPGAFALCGWFVVGSSLVLMMIPRRWHAGYARWWVRHLPLWSVRAIAPFSLLAGAGLVYAAG